MIAPIQTCLRTLPLLAAILSTLIIACQSGDEDQQSLYFGVPTFTAAHQLTEGSLNLSPVRLRLFKDTLFVSYDGLARIDLFNLELEKIRTIELTDPEPIFPTSFDISDSLIMICDHAKRVVVLLDREGRYVNSFGKLPDEMTQLSPFSVTYFGGVLYVGDLALRQVLAISVVDAKGITEMGELILQIPADTVNRIGFPSAVEITPDGRLLVGDAASGIVQVYTCDGRFVYAFDSVQTGSPLAPMSFAVDHLIDPEMQDSTSFDPSGIRGQGRIHVIDANSNSVLVFNPVGKYVTSYNGDGRLVKPSDIVISTYHRKIFIADPVAGKLFQFDLKTPDEQRSDLN